MLLVTQLVAIIMGMILSPVSCYVQVPLTKIPVKEIVEVSSNSNYLGFVLEKSQIHCSMSYSIGPLMETSSPNKIVGIVSWGYDCASDPGVYTRVSAFEDWISENTAGDSFVNCQAFKKSSCFSASNTVEVQGKGVVPINLLKIGDYVKAGKDKVSRVYSFSHINKNTETKFLQIHMEHCDMPLEISPDHLIYVGGKPVRAADVQVGNFLHGHRVSHITTVQRHGVYAPVTFSGDIMVNGVLASTYVSMLDLIPPHFQNHAAHILTGVHRMACKLSFSSCLEEKYDMDGISQFIHPIVNVVRKVNDGNGWIEVSGVVVATPLLFIIFCLEQILSTPFIVLLIVALLVGKKFINAKEITSII
jgi:hypothetical protein